MAPIESPEAVISKPSKKEKKEKKEKSAKKRAREEDGPADTPRKHKKSKHTTNGDAQHNEAAANGDVKKEKKKKKSKHLGDRVEEEERTPNDDKHGGTDAPAPGADEVTTKKKKSKKGKKEEGAEETPGAAGELSEVAKDKTKKKHKKHRQDPKSEPQPQQEEPQVDSLPEQDAMDVDTEAPSKPASGQVHQPPDIPTNPQFPFFNQTVSLYEPLYPSGWGKPITGCESQHLRHLQNRYVPSLRGVLLDYSKVSLGQHPGRADAATDDNSPAILASRNEFGGGFGWLTAEVKVFVPSRGAWMEGSVNIQTEGHIGVVCFGKFNASIEARRLPPSWQWVHSEQAEGFDETASVVTAADEHGVVRQIHSTGYWVDGSGDKVKGRVRFRIRNFDVGVSGDSTYLSLQGTMLDKGHEKKLVETEAREARERRERKGGRGWQRRALPDFSMTRFANEEEDTHSQGVEDAAAKPNDEQEGA